MSSPRPQPAPVLSAGLQGRGRAFGLAAVLATTLFLPGLTAPVLAQATKTPQAAPTAAAATTMSAGDQLLLLIPAVTGEGTPVERRQAAAGILQLDSEESVKALAGMLALKNNTAAKLAICEAIADTDNPPAALVEPLLSLLPDQKEPLLHDAVVSALYRYTDPTVVGRLRSLLEREELQWLRTENASRSRELYSLLPKESDRVVRLLVWLKAAQPLDRLTALEIVHSAMLATTPTPPTKEVLQQIRTMLRDPDENVRRTLVTVLRDLQEREDVSRIMGMLQHERSPLVLEEIYRTLGRMGDPESVQACVKGLWNANDEVAAAAADALGRLCRHTASDPAPSPCADEVVSAMLDKASRPMSDDLREQMTEAMAAIADARFLPMLVARAKLDEKLPQIRQAALSGIGQIGDASQIDLVIARLGDDPDLGVRDAAAEALGKLGSKATHLRPLYQRLTDPSQPLQNHAWEAYRKVFARLSWNERRDAVASWAGKDKLSIARRVDLLSDLETQAASAKDDASHLLIVREDLGDALLASTEYALAAAAYTRALELGSEQAERKLSLCSRLIDAYLHLAAYDKAIAVATSDGSPAMTNALGERLLAYVQDLAKTDPKTALDCIDRFKKAVPAVFTAERTRQFDEVRRTASQPTSLPSSR